jgi:hypothetical protein
VKTFPTPGLVQSDEGIEVFPGDQGCLAAGVVFEEGSRKTGGFFSLPFKLEGMQPSAGIFHVVNLLLTGGAPEVGIAEVVGVGVAFHALGEQEVFPQGAGVGAQGEGREKYEFTRFKSVKLIFFTDLKPGFNQMFLNCRPRVSLFSGRGRRVLI